MTEKNDGSPIILPDTKPGVLDGVQNRISISVAEDGQYTFAIGNQIPPYHLINVAALLHRMAMKMIDAYDMQQQRDAMQTAQVMQSLAKGRPPTDAFKK